MIGEHQVDAHTMEENKKRNALLAGLDSSPAKSVIVSPPSKKLKQCRLPFQLLAQSPTNQKPVTQIDQETNKRKRVVSGSSLESPVLSRAKTTENKPKITPVKKIKAISKSTSDAEVSSSSEGAVVSRSVLLSEADSSSQTPKHAVLDQFFYKTQQPEVSTSDGEDVNERSSVKSDAAKFDEKQSIKKIQIEVIDLCMDEMLEETKSKTTKTDSVQLSPDTSVQKSPTTAELKTTEDDDCIIIDTPKRSKVSIISPKQVDKKKSPKTSSPNKTGEVDVVTTPVRVLSATPVRKLSTPVLTDKTPEVKETTTPVTKGKTPNKTPKSAKALEKEADRKRKLEEREKLMKEKRQKLEEEKAEKQKVKDDAKAAKEKERLEAKRLKDLEKEKKEEERLEKKQKEEEAKQEVLRKREEEKKKKQDVIEAKLQEKKKKEEEKQKQEEEGKKLTNEKKLKQEKKEKAFLNFFTKAPEPAIIKEKSTPDISTGPFAAFQLKDGMTLAPRVRRVMDEPKKQELTKDISNQTTTASYLKDIKSTEFIPGKDFKTPCTNGLDTPVIPEGKQLVKCKYLKFHGNHRPAYYGTMRKKSSKIRPRKPFAMDEILDYEVDSDDEWEEPGESLSNSEGEDDPASDDDEDDDGFFVPHGYLSEDEGGNECEDGIKKMKEKQAAKAQAWEACLKKKIESLTPVLIGPMWLGDNNDNQSKQWKILQQYAAIVLVNTPIKTSFSKTSSTDGSKDANDDDKNTLKKKCVPKEAIPDLIRLVHGNTAGIKSLSRSFREYWDKKQQNIAEGDIKMDTSPGAEATCPIRGPTPVNDLVDNASRPTTPSSETDYSISVRQMKLKINKIAVRERRNGYDRDCWYVHEELLKKHNLLDLPVPNAAVKEKKSKNADICSPISTPKINQIAQFAKKLSPEAYQKQTQQNLAVLKEKQDQERLRKEQERALQLKLQQERIEKYKREQEKAAMIRMEQEKAFRLKMQQDAQKKAAQKKVTQYTAASNNFTPSTFVQSIQARSKLVPQVVLKPLPPLYTSLSVKKQPVNSKTSPPKKQTSVIELLAKKQMLNILKSSVVRASTANDSVPQKMEVDCGYSADSEGQGV